MNSTVGKLWKSWPAQAEQDGRAVVRIDGVRYERQLVRITSGAGLESVDCAANERISIRIGSDSGSHRLGRSVAV